MRKTNYEDYVTLFSDSGWKLIKGSRSGGAPSNFQQEHPDVTTREIFSDTDSQESVKEKICEIWLHIWIHIFIVFLYFF